MKTTLFVLIVTPFLFAANCPPTFPLGNSMVGINSGTLTPNRKRVSQFELVDTAYFTDIRAYVVPGGDNQPIRGVLYSDKDGLPDQLLGASIEAVITANEPGHWVSMKMIGTVQALPSKVWVGIISGPSLSPAFMKYTPGKTRVISTNDYVTGPSQTFGTPDVSLDGTMSVYAVYQTTAPSQCPSGACALAKWAAPEQNPDFPTLGYRLHYGQTSGVYTQSMEVEGLQALVTDLLPETNYCFAVKAFNAQGESPFSNEICITTLPGVNNLNF